MSTKQSTLLFIHGWATDRWVWAQQINELKNIYRCRDMNLPGHGGNGKWDKPNLEPPVKEVLIHLSSSKSGGSSHDEVTGIGWSLGAQVLLTSAIENKIKFNGLILIGATPCFVKKDDFPWAQPMPMVKKMIKDMKKKPLETIRRFYQLNFTENELETENAKSFIRKYTYRNFNVEIPRSLRSLGMTGGQKCHFEPFACHSERSEESLPLAQDKLREKSNLTLNETKFRYNEITTGLEALSKIDLRHQLGLLDIPVLIIHGGMDQICPVGASHYLKDKIKSAELKIFEKAGHAPFLTETEKFNKLMKGFICKILK